MTVIPVGAFTISPIGHVLRDAPLGGGGAAEGVPVRVQFQNISPLPLRVQIQLLPVSATLDDAAVIKASLAHGVMFKGLLGTARSWSKPSGVIPSGGRAVLHMRIWIPRGTPNDEWRGRVDISQMNIRPVIPPTTPAVATTPTTPATTPSATTPGATTPATVTPKAKS